MRPFAVALPIAIVTVLTGPVAAAAADGLPVPMDGMGVTTTVAPDGGGPRYATVTAGGETQLLRIDQDGGEITASRVINGNFTIPVVALDGTPAGLSADGRTLALIVPRTNYRRFPRAETTFRIVDVTRKGRLRPRTPFTLRGDFSFDAVSPDGRRMYLVQYTSSDYNDYEVREYDLVRRRLVADPVQFSHEIAPGEMRGLPMARATSSDGRFAYTLYNGGGGQRDVAFVHILDTVRSVSHCIEFPGISGQEAWSAKLGLMQGGRALGVKRGKHLLASMDTRTLAVAAPPWPRRIAAAKPTEGGISGIAVGALGTGLVLLAGAAFVIRRRRRPLPMPPDPFVTMSRDEREAMVHQEPGGGGSDEAPDDGVRVPVRRGSPG